MSTALDSVPGQIQDWTRTKDDSSSSGTGNHPTGTPQAIYTHIQVVSVVVGLIDDKKHQNTHIIPQRFGLVFFKRGHGTIVME